ncbi:MAG TPA: glycoside hydrolase family 28 protein [Telmatospirillum sp.]|nr:glycoside hydrolase family 28 protein [Telmatospirillum sp.]
MSSFEISRRLFCGGLAATAMTSGQVRKAWSNSVADPWSQAQAIIDRLAHPVSIPERSFDVTGFGAAACRRVPFATPYSSGMTHAPGSADNFTAFNATIAACHAAGGGRVLVPAGHWYCAGPITLRSNVDFHLNAGASILFSPNPADYAKYGLYACGPNGNLYRSRWQGNDCLNFGAPIYAFQQTNFALTGDDPARCILDGQSSTPFDGSRCWWTYWGRDQSYGHVKGAPSQVTANPLNRPLSDVAPGLPADQLSLLQDAAGQWKKDVFYLPALSEAGVPFDQRIFGLGHSLRPCMVEVIDCANVLLSGYQLNNTPFWQHHPVGCRDLAITNVHANSMGPNNDGFDPESCDTVLVDNVTFNTGDDCVAVKAGKDNDIGYGPARNHVFQNCTMNSGHGGITLGSEMAAGISDMFAQNIAMLNQNWETSPLNIALRIKANMNRGGSVQNFFVRNISLPNGVSMTPSSYDSLALPGSPIPIATSLAQGGVLTIDCDYQPAADLIRTRPPTVKNVHISNVTVTPPPGKPTSCYQAVISVGPVASDYNGTPPMPPISPVTGVTICDCDFGAAANSAQPFYLYNTQGMTLKNVTIGGQLYNQTLSG